MVYKPRENMEKGAVEGWISFSYELLSNLIFEVIENSFIYDYTALSSYKIPSFDNERVCKI